MIISEIIVAKTAGAIAASAALLAVIEAGTQNAIVNAVSLAITSATAILLAWIAFKQSGLARKQNELHETVTILEKNTNGMHKELALATAAQNKAEGKAEGAAEQKASDIAEAALIAKGKLEGAAVTAPAPPVPPVVYTEPVSD